MLPERVLSDTFIVVFGGPSLEYHEAAFARLGARVAGACIYDVTPAPEAAVAQEWEQALCEGLTCLVAATSAPFELMARPSNDALRSLREFARTRRVVVGGGRAVGAARRAGIEPWLAVATGRPRLLAEVVERTFGRGAVVGVLASGTRPCPVVQAMRNAGLQAVPLTTYRCRPLRDISAGRKVLEMLAADSADYAVFVTPAAVRIAMQVALESSLSAVLVERFGTVTKALASGPGGCDALRDLGVTRPLCPPRPGSKNLVAAVVGTLAVRVGDLPVVDVATNSASVGGRVVRLGRLEARLLEALVRRPQMVCRQRALEVEVWGTADGSRRLSVLISRLRRRLATVGVEIATVRKRGYLLRT